MGAALLLIYDLLRVLRKLIKHSNLVVTLEDLIFWLVSSVIIFAMLYEKNNGIIRGFSIGVMLIGMIVYNRTFSELFVKAMLQIIYYLSKPICFLYAKIKPIYHLIKLKIIELLKKIFKGLKNNWKSVRIKRSSRTQKKKKVASK